MTDQLIKNYYNEIKNPDEAKKKKKRTTNCDPNRLEIKNTCFSIHRELNVEKFTIRLAFYREQNPDSDIDFIERRRDQFIQIFKKFATCEEWDGPNLCNGRGNKDIGQQIEFVLKDGYDEEDAFVKLVKKIDEINSIINDKLCGYYKRYSNEDIKKICFYLKTESRNYTDLEKFLDNLQLKSYFSVNYIDYSVEDFKKLYKELKSIQEDLKKRGPDAKYGNCKESTIGDKCARIQKLISLFQDYPWLSKDYNSTMATYGGNMNNQTTDIEDKLKNNKQVILTGAPGTGKTYTVKDFVKKATGEETPGNHWMFVQFHPSYDYSDFVEGLKPVPDYDENDKVKGNIFVRLDGCFKDFCRKIVMNEVNEIAGISQALSEENPSQKSAIEQAFESYKEKHKKQNEPNSVELSEEEKDKYKNQYYFVIDEINRADLSKVFGEIMYCLDEEYRGPDNAIPTQYSALKAYHKKDNGKFGEYEFDCFENGFFIPDNLHIIGTMNDIDRSVESFDFALRRRFIWVEVEADKSLDELETVLKNDPTGIDALKAKAKNVNGLLDNPTYKKLGLNKQFYLGKAYYSSFDGTQESINEIYINKIEPIVKEYTRGRDNELVDKLLKAIKYTLNVKDQVSNLSPQSENSSVEENSAPATEENSNTNE